MNDLLIYNAKVYVDGNTLNQWVWCKDGRIEAFGKDNIPDVPNAEVIDADGNNLLPGFVDIHVHGGAGVDTMDASPDSLARMAQFYAQHGVTSFLATTWTDSNERISAALGCTTTCIGGFENGATLRGVHLEGPYLNPKRSGAQNTTYVRRANRDEVLAWLDLGVIRLLSLAPEYEENLWLIEECVQRGITVSAAHTDATYEDMVRAVSLGLRNTTHTFNAMSALHHRKPGVAGAAMAIPQLTCELIADNIHIHPAVMRLLWNAKNYQNVVLISDAIRAAGMPDGDYPMDERTVYVQDGVAQLEDGTLAGSTLTMDRALRNFMAATGSPLSVVYEAASLTPAEAAGIGDTTGSITPGKEADMVLLNDNHEVLMTIAQGRIVYEA